MSKMRGFSIDEVASGIQIRRMSAEKMIQRLRVAESQAIRLASTFQTRNYLTLEQIVDSLPPGPFEVELVAAYLSGYMASVTYESRFDLEVFGDMSSMGDGEDKVVGAALVALLNMVEKKGVRLGGPVVEAIPAPTEAAGDWDGDPH